MTEIVCVCVWIEICSATQHAGNHSERWQHFRTALSNATAALLLLLFCCFFMCTASIVKCWKGYIHCVEVYVKHKRRRACAYNILRCSILCAWSAMGTERISAWISYGWAREQEYVCFWNCVALFWPVYLPYQEVEVYATYTTVTEKNMMAICWRFPCSVLGIQKMRVAFFIVDEQNF